MRYSRHFSLSLLMTLELPSSSKGIRNKPSIGLVGQLSLDHVKDHCPTKILRERSLTWSNTKRHSIPCAVAEPCSERTRKFRQCLRLCTAWWESTMSPFRN